MDGHGVLGDIDSNYSIAQPISKMRPTLSGDE